MKIKPIFLIRRYTVLSNLKKEHAYNINEGTLLQ